MESLLNVRGREKSVRVPEGWRAAPLFFTRGLERSLRGAKNIATFCGDEQRRSSKGGGGKYRRKTGVVSQDLGLPEAERKEGSGWEMS